MDYKNSAVAAQEAAKELLSRLEWMTLKPRVIIDLGSGTGEFSTRLQAQYPDSQVLAIDASGHMIQFAKQQTSVSCIQADAHQLPLANQSVDLIFANLLVPWCADIHNLLKEWCRILRPEGVILFSALGPDTLKEWKDVYHNQIIPHFIDMHDVGDLMLQIGFSDPVLDVNYYTLTYSEIAKLHQELHALGMLHANAKLTLSNDEALINNKWAVTWEIVFAHAFMPPNKDEVSASSDGMVRVPLSHLRKQLQSK